MIKTTLLLALFCLCFLFADKQAISGIKELNKSNQADGIECLSSVGGVLSTPPFNHVDKKKEIAEAICNSHMTYHVPYQLIVSVIWVESTFKVNAMNGRNQGLMQLNTRYHKHRDLRTVKVNIDKGTEFLKQLIDQTGGITTAVSRFNGGDGNWKYIAKVNNAYNKFFS